VSKQQISTYISLSIYQRKLIPTKINETRVAEKIVASIQK